MEISYRNAIHIVIEWVREARWGNPVFGISWPEPVRVISGEGCPLERYLS